MAIARFFHIFHRPYYYLYLKLLSRSEDTFKREAFSELKASSTGC